jgi:DNA primase
MPADAVAEVKSRLDIVDVVGAYVRLDRAGRSWKALCPFHSERTPSFNVSQEKQSWYCFGCQEGGDVFTFVEKHEHLSFLQALEMLAERAGVELERRGGDGRGAGRRRHRAMELNAHAQAFYEHVLWSTELGAQGRDLLDQRGVSEELARVFGIGFAPAGGGGGDALVRWLVSRGHGAVEEVVAAGLAHPADRGGARDRFRNRLVFPIRDERTQVLGFGGRALGDAVPKYLNTPATEAYDKSKAVFGIELARPVIGSAGSVLLVEGYFDVVAAHAAGIHHAVASSGTALTTAQVRLLARFTKVITLCFDADDAGQAAATRAVDTVCGEGLEARIVVLPAGFKDPDELVKRDPAAFARVVEEAKPGWEVLLDVALAGAESGSVEERRGGAERAVAVLARIPEASARELYAQRAAGRLGLEPATLLADVTARMARAARSGPAARVVVPMPAPQARTDASSAAGVPAPANSGQVRRAEPIPAYEAYLGSIAAQRPDLVPTLLEDIDLRLGDLRSPIVRELLERAGDAYPGTVPELAHLEAEDRRALAWLSLREVPELADDAEPDVLQRAVADNARRVRRAAVLAEQADVRRELRVARDAGRAADAEELALHLARLGAEAHALTTPGPAETAAAR